MGTCTSHQLHRFAPILPFSLGFSDFPFIRRLANGSLLVSYLWLCIASSLLLCRVLWHPSGSPRSPRSRIVSSKVRCRLGQVLCTCPLQICPLHLLMLVFALLPTGIVVCRQQLPDLARPCLGRGHLIDPTTATSLLSTSPQAMRAHALIHICLHGFSAHRLLFADSTEWHVRFPTHSPRCPSLCATSIDVTYHQGETHSSSSSSTSSVQPTHLSHFIRQKKRRRIHTIWMTGRIGGIQQIP